MAHVNSAGYDETSQQGNLKMLNQDVQRHIQVTDNKISRLQERLEMLIGMNEYLRKKTSKWNDSLKEEEEDVGDNYQVSPQQK